MFCTVIFPNSLKVLKGRGWVCQYENRGAGSVYGYSGTPLWAANKLPAFKQWHKKALPIGRGVCSTPSSNTEICSRSIPISPATLPMTWNDFQTVLPSAWILEAKTLFLCWRKEAAPATSLPHESFQEETVHLRLQRTWYPPCASCRPDHVFFWGLCCMSRGPSSSSWCCIFSMHRECTITGSQHLALRPKSDSWGNNSKTVTVAFECWLWPLIT